MFESKRFRNVRTHADCFWRSQSNGIYFLCFINSHRKIVWGCSTWTVITILFYSILFYSRLCPSTTGSSPPPESSISLCPLLSLSIPFLVAPQCHLSNDVLVFRLILHPLSALCASNSPSIIFHSGDVSSPYPFRIGYVLDYVCQCHSGSLPNGGVTNSAHTKSCSLTCPPWVQAGKRNSTAQNTPLASSES